MAPEDIVQFLDWDSEFFRLRVARVKGDRIDAEVAERLKNCCRRQRIDCLYFLADPADPMTLKLAEEHGFRLLDIRANLAMKLSAEPRSKAPQAAEGVRPARLDDIPPLQRIARTSHRDTRFYFDCHFRREDCDRFYETWIANSCQGYADTVLVVECEGVPAGYITCHLDEGANGRIGLFAVDAAWRSRGLGCRLVDQSLDWFQRQGMKRASVVTQGHNQGALRIYQRCGFSVQSLQLWYHRWFVSTEAAKQHE